LNPATGISRYAAFDCRLQRFVRFRYGHRPQCRHGGVSPSVKGSVFVGRDRAVRRSTSFESTRQVKSVWLRTSRSHQIDRKKWRRYSTPRVRFLFSCRPFSCEVIYPAHFAGSGMRRRYRLSSNSRPEIRVCPQNCSANKDYVTVVQVHVLGLTSRR
jgi:hypothetical protein